MRYIDDINILGTDYLIHKAKRDDDLDGDNGRCETLVKHIYLADDIDGKNPKHLKDVHMFEEKVLRHEIIHAFMHEAGVGGVFNQDEDLVDWLAWMIPKMSAAFEESQKLLERYRNRWAKK